MSSRLLITNADHRRWLEETLDHKHVRVQMSTYGFSYGLEPSLCRTKLVDNFNARILNQINKTSTPSQILIGCAEPIACIAEAPKVYRRTRFAWRPDLHLKCFIVHSKSRIYAIVGGRNFTDSGWYDVSAVIPTREAERLSRYFDNLWESARGIK